MGLKILSEDARRDIHTRIHKHTHTYTHIYRRSQSNDYEHARRYRHKQRESVRERERQRDICTRTHTHTHTGDDTRMTTSMHASMLTSSVQGQKVPSVGSSDVEDQASLLHRIMVR